MLNMTEITECDNAHSVEERWLHTVKVVLFLPQQTCLTFPEVFVSVHVMHCNVSVIKHITLAL